MEHPEFNITGTHIWYYYCCPREVWLMLHQVNPDQDDANLDLGRFIHEMSYARDRNKEISLGNIRLDIVRQDKEGLVIGEVKKSSKYAKSARMQLGFYLMELKERGIEAKGELLFPKERKKEEVVLTEEMEKELLQTMEKIGEFAAMDRPPQPQKIHFCKNCAYKEFCWA
ncbi:CRISPR-associated protein Cas4 [Dehalobacterium formicoaceticum]|uniref:CRISPR-associated exonuclease Cas4 n=1 Tax=Dehalobacterium formicoaceticum TaxID=51515 RepID=A0ABT1Y7L3_9FIRM|nr:CRISPR-associated protein Cas4 [Dehalobacterium formicoaceticum]MCR6546872.1 CRISPR-associated protein Cas4 [Dehalobacterium formicoaceticum]